MIPSAFPVRCALLLALLASAGCTTVVRENIISSINTGVGVSIAENPQTQLYEIKAGYIRSQFYSIPTGKKVEDGKGQGASITNAANVTPEVVAGIRMKSDARHLFLGMDIAENFAVGEVGVMSPAAVAMYVSQAATATSANAASLAAESVAKAAKSTKTIPAAPSPETGELLRQAGELRNRSPANREKADAFVKKEENGGFASWNAFVESNPSKETLQKLIQTLK